MEERDSCENADTDRPTTFLCDGDVLFQNGNGFIYKETEYSSKLTSNSPKVLTVVRATSMGTRKLANKLLFNVVTPAGSSSY